MYVIFAKFRVLTYPKVQKTFIHKTYHANSYKKWSVLFRSSSE